MKTEIILQCRKCKTSILVDALHFLSHPWPECCEERRYLNACSKQSLMAVAALTTEKDLLENQIDAALQKACRELSK